jgi:hypothetical protein
VGDDCVVLHAGKGGTCACAVATASFTRTAFTLPPPPPKLAHEVSKRVWDALLNINVALVLALWKSETTYEPKTRVEEDANVITPTAAEICI